MRSTLQAPSRAQVARWVVEAWAAIPVRAIVRAAVVTGGARVCDFSAEDRVRYDLDNLKIDPLIIHLVTTHGTIQTLVVVIVGYDVLTVVVVGYEDS